MCVIIYKPRKVYLQEQTIRKAWTTNPHGAGFIAKRKEQTVMHKGFMSVETLIQAVESYKKWELVLHFRLATHGAKTPENTHPFICGKSMLFHNGILSSFGESGDKGISDSMDFANLLSFLPEKDRLKLLEEVNGKFAYVSDKGISLHGHFEKYRGLKVSNTYFDHTTRFSSHTSHQTAWGSAHSLPERYNPLKSGYKGVRSNLSLNCEGGIVEHDAYDRIQSITTAFDHIDDCAEEPLNLTDEQIAKLFVSEYEMHEAATDYALAEEFPNITKGKD